MAYWPLIIKLLCLTISIKTEDIIKETGIETTKRDILKEFRTNVDHIIIWSKIQSDSHHFNIRLLPQEMFFLVVTYQYNRPMLRCCQLSPPVSACSCMCSHILICTNCDISLWLQDNLFEWHFSVRGPPDSDFDGGVYHGRIVLPPEYPMKPPSIILLTVRWRESSCFSPFSWSRTGTHQIRL